jgi:hypothetical protein
LEAEGEWMKRQKILTLVLATSFVLPLNLPAQQAAVKAPAASTPPQIAQANQTPQAARPQSKRAQRSYERETKPRHHSRISKKEVAFMAAIAGTSMGIGALAGGAKGLAIGSIVGGWGAYVGHRFWKWIH